MRDARLCLFVVALSVSACGEDASDIPSECNPLGGQGCMRPWPSSVYEVADSSTATGRRLEVPIEAMPKNIDGVYVDPTALNRWDGWSPTGPLLATFGTEVSVTLTRVAKSLLGRLLGALIPIAGGRTLGKQLRSVLARAEAR